MINNEIEAAEDSEGEVGIASARSHSDDKRDSVSLISPPEERLPRLNRRVRSWWHQDSLHDRATLRKIDRTGLSLEWDRAVG